MLPTPSTSHVCFDKIYEPSEDSYLLLDALSSVTESTFLSERFKAHCPFTGHNQAETPSPLVVEIGTGSGVVLAFLTAHAKSIIGRADLLTLGTDVNSFACLATRETVDIACNSVSHQDGNEALYLDSVVTDLSGPIRPGLIDVLVFNPPYVPTPELPGLPAVATTSGEPNFTTSFEYESHLLSLSYAGGIDGMETTNRLLEQIPGILSVDRGVAYILLCAQNMPEDVKARIRTWGSGWDVETVAQSGKKGGWEKLQIIRIWRT
ncbi:MAG: S-adenosylmethionine-dependent methyltransferase [Pycnora praestabilis]|nr:MAG: S-adenosylmethionine-dependent methyltransferase [Pycnora praestabilis]